MFKLPLALSSLLSFGGGVGKGKNGNGSKTASRSTSATSAVSSRDDLRFKSARLGQPLAYKSKSQKQISSWWSSEMSPRSIRLQERGFQFQGAELPSVAAAKVNLHHAPALG